MAEKKFTMFSGGVLFPTFPEIHRERDGAGGSCREGRIAVIIIRHIVEQVVDGDCQVECLAEMLPEGEFPDAVARIGDFFCLLEIGQRKVFVTGDGGEEPP